MSKFTKFLNSLFPFLDNVSIENNDLNSIGNSISNKIKVKSPPSIISETLLIEGKIFDNGILEVEGKINGNINGNVVVLRKESMVNGDIVAKDLTISGKMQGNIRAENLRLLATSNFTGKIEYKSVFIENGASIDGILTKVKDRAGVKDFPSNVLPSNKATNYVAES